MCVVKEVICLEVNRHENVVVEIRILDHSLKGVRLALKKGRPVGANPLKHRWYTLEVKVLAANSHAGLKVAHKSNTK